MAKGVKEQLVKRAFPTASVRLFTTGSDPDSNLTEFAGEAMLVTAPDIEALDTLDIAFLCGTRQEGERYLDWPSRAGFRAIDLSGASDGAGDVPLVNASVNPQAIRRGAPVIGTPHAVSQMLSTLLAPIHAVCGLEEAIVVALQPASEHGQPGIDELYQQSLSLLNFQEMPKEIFGRQLAFNVIPGWLSEASKTASITRADLEKQVAAITGGGFALAVQTLQAPVFHGHTALIHLTLRAGKGREDLLASFRQSEEVHIGRRGDPVTPVERAGEGGVLLSGVQPGLKSSSFWMWVAADDLAGGRARNAVRIAEILLNEPVAGGRA